MTCFWQGLVSSLGSARINATFVVKGKHRKTMCPRKFVQLLKSKNQLCDHVTWNGEPLHQQFKKESYEAVQCLNFDSLKAAGYLCSTCDPVLILVCEVFHCTIEHCYNGKWIRYQYNVLNTVPNTEKVCSIIVYSNKDHFWSE